MKKKIYTTPCMKVVDVHSANMLCVSGGSLGVIYDQISDEVNEYSDYEGYGDSW